jgi:hypothetical protein
MNVPFSFLQPGEQVIFYSKGVPTREFLAGGLILLVLSPFIVAGVGTLKYHSALFTLIVIFMSLFWLSILAKLIIRALAAKNILTDRRVILIAYNFPWDRVEIPLSDIENIIDKSIKGTQIILRSQKAVKYYAIANSKAFVNAYNQFISSNRSP